MNRNENSVVRDFRTTEEKNLVDVMTDKQFDKIIQMIRMILDGCNDLDEAKKKFDRLCH